MVPVLATPIPETPSSANSEVAPPPHLTRTRGVSRPTRPTPKKLLFLRNTATHPPQIVKLACPDCARTDFSSLQGLLNHCRLRHRREFGSHDECVQSAAVLIEGEEQQNWVVENGTEVAGISLPGLRRLFEIAVSGDRPVLPVALPSAPSQSTAEPTLDDSNEDPTPAAEELPEAPASSLLTRTLGHHEDTPALAPFLGRAPKQRRVHIYETEDPIDIFTAADNRLPRSGSWRIRYAGRSQAVDPSSESEQTESAPPPQPSSPADSRQEFPELQSPRRDLLHGSGSRFHILARVTVEDQSFWIPEGEPPIFIVASRVYVLN